MGSGARVIRRDAPVSRQNKLLTGRTTIVIAPPGPGYGKAIRESLGRPYGPQRNRSRLWIP